jgi:hypothetical protein
MGRIQKRLHIEWFLKGSSGSQHFGDIEEIQDADHVTATGNGNHARGRELTAQCHDSFEPVLIGHENVHDDEIRGLGPIPLQALLPVAGFLYVISRLFQGLSDQLADLIFVVND